ncbi:choice-of-anchor W domain-containing protein [Nostoc sp. FACHB-110]|uniref:choice-of-anchor W domain-containing protein n=1 Tax=Nostoc sp. FACHB-110 TaxID=2692834 RepID=UPI0028C37E1E|nr:choice-of-anchor W domain-containing protein [Nostoc sp. FACHB-110]
MSLVPLTSQDADSDFDDTDFNLLLDKGDFKELFVAEGRIGNNGTGGNGEREIGINRNVRATVGAGLPVAKADFTWGNSKVWDFSLEYTGSKVTYKVFDTSQTFQLVTQEFSGPVTDIFFRTFANKGSGNNLQNSVALTNLILNGTALGNLASSATTTADLDYLHLAGISTPFTLTGKTALSWVGTAPSRSNLAFQIKVGTSQSVPEPTTLGAIFVASMTGVAALKRKKAAIQ